MFYINDALTLTRRESSLITPNRELRACDLYSEEQELNLSQFSQSARPSTFQPEPRPLRPRGWVQSEIVTLLFESMLDDVVETWHVISQEKYDPLLVKSPSLGSNKKKSRTASIIKQKVCNKASTSKINLNSNNSVDIVTHESWWSLPDEKAIIRFKNGNVYEGNISKKVMHGEGRLQWADGTVYLGKFQNGEMHGQGKIAWKDDTWYEGGFAKNVRHGHGLYVNSRRRQMYHGGWHYGTKHGKGIMYFDDTFENSYDGDWVYNIREGSGIREFNRTSAYIGEFDFYVREGHGIMIWSNHDFYEGGWTNDLMSGIGLYIWAKKFNNTMSLARDKFYFGDWYRGLRHGFGILDLGSEGARYEGEFNGNMKHGSGYFVNNNGLVFRHKKLFIDDVFGNLRCDSTETFRTLHEGDEELDNLSEVLEFPIVDSTIGLYYHVNKVLSANLNEKVEAKGLLITEYMKNMFAYDMKNPASIEKTSTDTDTSSEPIGNIKNRALFQLHRALKYYQAYLSYVYYKYATICNTEELFFPVVLTRLYLWQFLYDCNLYSYGLTLVDIDLIIHRSPLIVTKKPHDPFEQIALWQFVHVLIELSSILFVDKDSPCEVWCDTKLSNAFRIFMNIVVIPSINSEIRLGNLTNYGSFVPLKALYKVYKSIGEPHTVRKFLCAVRRPYFSQQPDMVDADVELIYNGKNAYIIGNDMKFINDKPSKSCQGETKKDVVPDNLPLFNFGNLPSKDIISIFNDIFSTIVDRDHNLVINMGVKINFFEFFEVFITCALKSIELSRNIEPVVVSTEDQTQ